MASNSPRFELGESGPDVAAQKRDLEIGAKALHLGLAAKRGGADHCALGQVRERSDAQADECVPNILARQIAGDDEAVRQNRRQILGGMHGEIDLSLQESGVEFLREQALAAGLRQRPVLDGVARGLDDAERKLDQIPAKRRREALLPLVRLRQRQRTAARADDQSGAIRHNESSTARRHARVDARLGERRCLCGGANL